MKMKLNSFMLLKYFLLFSISILLFSTEASAQVKNEIQAVSSSEFAGMDASQQTVMIHLWIDASRQNEVPVAVEEKAILYYKQNNINERIYQKYKILLQTITNESLPISNRISACTFVIANYPESLFPVLLVKELLQDLNRKSK